MAIKAGTEGGGAFRRRGKTPSSAQPPKPFRPVENSFPEKKQFRLGQYRVLEEKDDYIICRGYDPNAENPLAQFTPSTPIGRISVAKPPALQRTPWDGSTVTIAGVEYTYEYSDDEPGVRTVRWTENGEEMEEEERIYVPYTLDEEEVEHQIIVAVEIRKNATIDGTDVREEATEDAPEGARLRWMDLNVSGRNWRVTKTAPTVIRFTIESIDSAAGTAEVTVDGWSCRGTEPTTPTVTVYDALGCLLNEDPASDLIGRKGYATRMHAESDPAEPDVELCRWEITALCCPPE